jgi:hypothetical protein
MERSQSIVNISKAIAAVMKEVKGIDKSMTVGEGKNAYKGVSDKDVKNAIGKSMEANGLSILPTEVEPTLQIDRWEQEDFYNGKSNGIKQKQSVFTSVKTKYLLLHTSGEYIEIAGYGHGTDTQDKAAGKATTYALKYVLLYTFLVPTGKIDDADATHSDDIEAPKAPVKKTLSDKAINDASERIKKGEVELYDKLTATYSLTEAQLQLLITAKQNKAA